MKIFKNKGELTRFQILSEIARNQPHLRQKDIAGKLGITIQAVSENIKSLVENGYMESGTGRSRYKITKKGIERIKKEAISLRNYSDEVLETMNTYKSVWPAIAQEDLETGDEVGLFMKDGTLFASKKTATAHAKVLSDVQAGEDVALISLGGTIELSPGNVVILVLSTVKEGGSRTADI
ncbi:MAG: winged helix-turn-helix transcriptional regulator, partial [Methanobacteriaceae archaeon]|nr:winged helix-turn-helix transcriptional regulator [Methanobacteriaceae archaeon]